MSDAVTSPAVGIAGHGGMPGMPVLPPAPRYQVRKCTNISAAFGMFFPTAPGTGGGGWRYRRRQHRCPLEEEWRQDRVVSDVDGGGVRCTASETKAYRRQGCTPNTSSPSTPALRCTAAPSLLRRRFARVSTGRLPPPPHPVVVRKLKHGEG